METKLIGTIKPELVFKAIAEIVNQRAKKDGVPVEFSLKKVEKKEKIA